MTPGAAVATATVVAVLLIMAGEAVLSRVHEAGLRRRGAIEPPGDVYRAMRWAYPTVFIAMGVEGALTGPAPSALLAIGLAVLGGAKALKLWAMTSLGDRWSFRVLVLPGVPLITRGPYRLMRHPNYVAVVGELVGVALTVWAPLAGVAAVSGFGWLLRRRIRVEDGALGRRGGTP